eukprot:s5750_g6.t1
MECVSRPETPLQQHAQSLRQEKIEASENFPMLFPMYTVTLDAALRMTTLKPHEELFAAGELSLFEDGLGKALFVSHQWVSQPHPDPEFKQFRVLQEALRNVTAGLSQISMDTITEAVFGLAQGISASEFRASKLFLWYDFFSVPQVPLVLGEGGQCENMQQRAICSIPAYISRCQFFMALCPVIDSPDGSQVFSQVSWSGHLLDRVLALGPQASAVVGPFTRGGSKNPGPAAASPPSAAPAPRSVSVPAASPGPSFALRPADWHGSVLPYRSLADLATRDPSAIVVLCEDAEQVDAAAQLFRAAAKHTALLLHRDPKATMTVPMLSGGKVLIQKVPADWHGSVLPYRSLADLATRDPSAIVVLCEDAEQVDAAAQLFRAAAKHTALLLHRDPKATMTVPMLSGGKVLIQKLIADNGGAEVRLWMLPATARPSKHRAGEAIRSGAPFAYRKDAFEYADRPVPPSTAAQESASTDTGRPEPSTKKAPGVVRVRRTPQGTQLHCCGRRQLLLQLHCARVAAA